MATARLKRKAEADPDLLADASLGESFVTYGTPLPSLNSTKRDKGEYVPLWQQEVRDEQGRRRLHGAFTGGFSAGYFNTVGSKEGWTPSTFVSSKEAKLAGRERAVAKPEDFMDEEDLAELKASRTFKANDQFDVASTASQSRGTDVDANYDSAVANSLRDLVQPGSSKIGHRIMQKMGWKPGQGIGPRVTFARRREQMRRLGLTANGQQDAENDQADDEAKKHLYPPVDRPLESFDVKDDSHGLGYVAGRSLQAELSGEEALRASSFTRKGKATSSEKDTPAMPRGGAFGLSALEDADDDDNDVYGASTSALTNVIMEDSDHDYRNGSLRRQPELLQNHALSGTKSSVNERRKPLTPITGIRKETFSDGSPVIPGFVLAAEIQPPDKWFPVEAAPKNFKPNPRAVWDRERLKDASTIPSTNERPKAGEKGKNNTLTADDRAVILGEPVAPKSVFEFLSAKNKERLDGFIESAKVDAVNRDNQSAGYMQGRLGPELGLIVPPLDARTAQSALKGFMPYGDDLAKQSRYKAYITASAVPGDITNFKPSPLPGTKIADLNRELTDFASAANIFKPMSGMMANRFTAGSSTSTLMYVKAPEAGLRVPTPKSLEDTEKDKKSAGQRTEQEKDNADPRRVAVRMGQYGQLTRSVEVWHPARLLCKRFNVADPHPDTVAPDEANSRTSATSAPHPSSTPVLDNDTMNDILKHRSFDTQGGMFSGHNFSSTASDHAQEASAGDAASGAAQKAAIPTIDNVGLGEDETQGRDTLTYVKPSMDIFKAIFADSEDETEEAEEDTDVGSSRRPVNLQPPAEMLAVVAPDNSTEESRLTTPAIPLTMESISSFKPTFMAKSERAKKGDDVPSDKKRKKSRFVTPTAMSFDMDEDGAERKPDKKRKNEKTRNKSSNKSSGLDATVEEDEWVEKEVPAAIPLGQPPHVAYHKKDRIRASELF